MEGQPEKRSVREQDIETIKTGELSDAENQQGSRSGRNRNRTVSPGDVLDIYWPVIEAVKEMRKDYCLDNVRICPDSVGAAIHELNEAQRKLPIQRVVTNEIKEETTKIPEPITDC